jgi:RNA polymerase sigma-70 factor (family 1)
LPAEPSIVLKKYGNALDAMSSNHPYRPNEVLRHLTDGSASAFKQIYDCYWLSIYKTVRRYTKSPEIAEDIVQEIFTALWNNRSRFKEVTNLEYYLITMAKNLTYKTMRKLAFEQAVKNRWSSSERLHEEYSANDAILDQQYAQLIQDAVGLLPSQQKQVFHMAKVEGLSHKDIAAQLKISHLTVKTHMAKALRSIRHFLQPHLSNYLLWVLILSS